MQSLRPPLGDGSLPTVRPDELERRLQERLDALGPAELLHVLMLSDFERADRIVTRNDLHPRSRWASV